MLNAQNGARRALCASPANRWRSWFSARQFALSCERSERRRVYHYKKLVSV